MKEVEIRELTCCYCATRTFGRQWYNRDKGFGLCVLCIDYCKRGEDAESMQENYGIEGYHYNVILTEVETCHSA